MHGAHLRKGIQGLDEALLGQVAWRRHNDDEGLAGVAPFADDKVAEVALLRLLVVGREGLLVRPRLDGIADRVTEVGREPAALDVEHLVPAPGLVEAECDPAAVVLLEGVLELVPVAEDGLGREERLEREALEATDPGKRVRDLRLLCLDLRLVGEILEATTAASGVVRAWRLDARRACLDDLERRRLGVVSFHLRHPGTNRVSRKPAADEDDEPVQARDAVPAVGE